MNENKNVESCIDCPRFNQRFYSPCNASMKVSALFGDSGINTIWDKEVNLVILDVYIALAKNCKNKNNFEKSPNNKIKGKSRDFVMKKLKLW